MTTEFASVVCKLESEWTTTPLIYRLWINEELFAERTWVWPCADYFVEEFIQIDSVPGKYSVRCDLINPEAGRIWIDHLEIKNAPEGSRTYKNSSFRIGNETQGNI